ncbi:MAG: phage tail tip lysozyme, partial [Terriglobales bacterium]
MHIIAADRIQLAIATARLGVFLMTAPDRVHEHEHTRALKQAEHQITSDLQHHHGSSQPDYHHIYTELNHLREQDHKLYGQKGAQHFQHDVDEINHHLKAQHLPGLDTGIQKDESKILKAAQDGHKSHDYSGVYGYLNAQHAADEQKYGKDLGNLLFSNDVKDLNRYLHKHNLSDVTLVDGGNGNFSVKERQAHPQPHQPAETTVSTSGQTAETMHRYGASHRNTEGGATQAVLSHYLNGSNPSDNLVGPSGAQLGSGEQANANQIMSLLIKPYGLTPAGAAAIVGNMMQENSLHTDFNSGGAGLCQWIGSRKSDLIAFANQHGESPTSVEAQVGFMMKELGSGYSSLLNELKTTNNAQQAALDFSRLYERPGNPQN